MKWLITGGLGFIGTNLVMRVLARGDSCRILDNESTGRRETLEQMFSVEGVDPDERGRVEVVLGDVTHPDAVIRASSGCDATVHLAAHTNVIESLETPTECFNVNAFGTLNVLEAARKQGIPKVVLASSNAAVGVTPPPASENAVPRPISPYGATKLAGEALGSGYAFAYDIGVVALRFANVYGPYSKLKSSVVALFLKQIIAGQPLVLYDAGRPTRDYVHVRDIVQAIERAVDRGGRGTTYQVGTGVETSTRQLVEVLEEVTGREIDTRDAPARKGEISRNYSDISRAASELGFVPSVQLREGVGGLWDWFLAHGDSADG